MSNEKSAPKTVKDVTFVYTSTNEPQKQLNPENRPPLSTNPLEFHSWEIKILVGESVFKSMKKAFSGAKNFPNVKEFSAAECVEKNFMTELPDEDQVLIKFTQACLRGPAANRQNCKPVTQIGVVGRVQDRNGLTVDSETVIGNGSKGHLQFQPVQNNYGLYLYPSAICITELVERAAATGGSSVDEDAFGIESVSEVVSDTSDDFEDDIPF